MQNQQITNHTALICTHGNCKRLQTADSEYCEIHELIANTLPDQDNDE